MRFDQMTPELREKAQKCETAEERMAFIEDSGIELTDEQLDGIAGGDPPWKKTGGNSTPTCPKSSNGKHEWVPTGRTRPGSIFGDIWPDKEKRCKWCGKTKWFN